MGLTAVAFTVLGEAISWRDLVLLAGGLFLLVKGTLEIHHMTEGEGEGEGESSAGKRGMGLAAAIAQIGRASCRERVSECV